MPETMWCPEYTIRNNYYHHRPPPVSRIRLRETTALEAIELNI